MAVLGSVLGGGPAMRAFAMDVTMSPMSFGQIAFLSTAAPQRIELSPLGQMFVSSGVLVVSPGTPSELTIFGAPPNTMLTLSFMANPIARSVMSERFVIQEWSGDSSMITNSDGELTMRLGATLISEAGEAYRDTEYSGSVALTISY